MGNSAIARALVAADHVDLGGAGRNPARKLLSQSLGDEDDLLPSAPASSRMSTASGWTTVARMGMSPGHLLGRDDDVGVGSRRRRSRPEVGPWGVPRPDTWLESRRPPAPPERRPGAAPMPGRGPIRPGRSTRRPGATARRGPGPPRRIRRRRRGPGPWGSPPSVPGQGSWGLEPRRVEVADEDEGKDDQEHEDPRSGAPSW